MVWLYVLAVALLGALIAGTVAGSMGAGIMFLGIIGGALTSLVILILVAG